MTVLAATLLGLYLLAPEQDPREFSCPVRFEELPVEVTGTELAEARFSAGDLDEIRLIHPRENGFFLVAVEDASTDASYGHYYSDVQAETRSYPLELGFRGMAWSTAGVATEEYVQVVRPGTYRVIMKYLASRPIGNGGPDGRTTICIAISGSFELKKAIYLHRFER